MFETTSYLTSTGVLSASISAQITTVPAASSTRNIVEPPTSISQTGPAVGVTTSTVLPPPPTVDTSRQDAFPVYVVIIIVVVILGIIVAFLVAGVMFWRIRKNR